MGAIVLSFFDTMLFCAIIVFCAFLFVWALNRFVGITFDGEVMKWGRIVIGLICFIAFLRWLFAVLGMVAYPHYFPGVF